MILFKRVMITGIAVFMFIWAMSAVTAKTVYADQYGYNANDATSALQSALHDPDASTIIVKNMGTPWIVRPIFIRRDNLTIIFNEGVVLKAKSGGFPKTNDCLVRCDGRENIVIKGYGATFQMLKNEYNTGQWRHCLSLNNCSHISVLGLTCKDSGGDGFYIGDGLRTPGHYYCDNIVIKDCTADNNRRNGYSIISAKDLLITDCVSKNNKGYSPEAGLDFEPNYSSETLTNCIVRNSRFVGNSFYQFQVGLRNLDASQTVSISVQNCYFSGNGLNTAYGAVVAGSNAAMQGGGCRGAVEMVDCVFENIALQAFRLQNNANGMLVKLTRCTFRNVSTAATSLNDPIQLIAWNVKYSPEYGHLSFVDCVFYDPQNVHEYFMSSASEPKTSSGCANISGNIKIISSDIIKYNLGAKPHNISLVTTHVKPGDLP